MASKKRKPNEPVPEQLATADTVGNTDQDDGGKEENDEDKVEVRLLVKVRKMLKKYSKSVNAKEELYKQVKLGVVVE